MKINEIQILHVRAKDQSGRPFNNGGTTLVYRINDTYQIEVGAAVCSKNDSYFKKLGVVLAKEQLEVQGKGYGVFDLDVELKSDINTVAVSYSKGLLTPLINSNPVVFFDDPKFIELKEIIVAKLLNAVTDPTTVPKFTIDAIVKKFFTEVMVHSINPFNKGI